MLEASGHVTGFIKIFKDKTKSVPEIKTAIWALGHIGSSKTGYRFLEKDGIIKIIGTMAEISESLSLRGTCFYVLGMLSRIEQAREVLETIGWESPTNLTSFISVPKDIKNSAFFKVPKYTYEGSFAVANEIEYPEDPVEARQEILTAVGHLSNSISAESASRTLKRLKATYPEHFASVSLLYQVFKLLGTYKFRNSKSSAIRKFIYDIFDAVPWDEETWTTYDSL